MLYIWSTAFLIGALSLASIALIGAWIIARSACSRIVAGGVDWRWMLAPAAGWIATAGVGGIALAFGVGAYVGAVIPLMLVGALADRHKVVGYWRDVPIPIVPVILILGAAVAQIAVLAIAHAGPLRANDLFWAIYRITEITPGDSPQALMQAQYLLHGSGLDGVDFSLFDRTFGAGITTAEIMCGVGRCPGRVLYENRMPYVQIYASIWIFFNALFMAALWQVAWIFARARATSIALLLGISPFVVLYGIGLWPKLFALYVLIAACGLVWAGRIWSGLILSGAAFFAHASFLWPHLALAYLVAAFLVIRTGETADIKRRLAKSAFLILVASLAPVLWFAGEKMAAGSSPLRIYYLYDVLPTEALHRDLSSIVASFYQHTHPENLIALPFFNLFKALIPQQVLQYALAFSYKGELLGARDIANELYVTMFHRVPYTFGLVLGVLSLAGIARFWRSQWVISALVLVLFLLPLLPAAGLYRKDDHFSTPVILFALLPILVGLCLKLSAMNAKAFLCIAGLAFIEFTSVYVWRSNLPRYHEAVDFYRYVPVALCAAALASLCLLECRAGPALEPVNSPAPRLSVRNWKISSISILSAACILAVAVMPLMPLAVLIALRDGGFRTHGEAINLLRWQRTSIDRNGGPYSGTQQATTVGASTRRSVWLQSGQSMWFTRVRIGPGSVLSAYAAILPGQYKDRSIDPVQFEILVFSRQLPPAVVRWIMNPSEKPDDRDWREIRVDIGRLGGDYVDISFRAMSGSPVLVALGEPRVLPGRP